MVKRKKSKLRDNFKIGDTIHWKTSRTKGKYAFMAETGVVKNKGPRKATVRLDNGDVWHVPYSMMTLVKRPQPLSSDQIVDAPAFCEAKGDMVPSSIPPGAVPFLAGDRAYIDRDWDKAGKVAGTILRKSKKTFTFQPDFEYRGSKDSIKVYAYELRPILPQPPPPTRPTWDEDPFALERVRC